MEKQYHSRGETLFAVTVYCNTHFGWGNCMVMEWCKAVEEEIQAAVHGHCSMGLATLGMQVGHSHGLLVAVAGLVVVGKDWSVQG